MNLTTNFSNKTVLTAHVFAKKYKLWLTLFKLAGKNLLAIIILIIKY